MAFEAFGTGHAIGVGLALAVIAAVPAGRKALRSKRAGRAARLTLAGLLVAGELSLYVWYEATDNWGYHSLPFQLCSLMIWLSAALLLTRSRVLYDIVFFLGFLGALQALLTPNLDSGYPTFRFFHFFVVHGAIIAAGLFMTVVEGWRPKASSIPKALGWLHVLAIPAAVANALTGSNFMFLARKPATSSLLDLLAPWPWYLLQLEAVALGLCMALYGLVRLFDLLSRGKPAVGGSRA